MLNKFKIFYLVFVYNCVKPVYNCVKPIYGFGNEIYQIPLFINMHMHAAAIQTRINNNKYGILMSMTQRKSIKTLVKHT